MVPREVHGTHTPQESIREGPEGLARAADEVRGSSLGEGGLETAQRFVNIEDDESEASSAVIGGTASPARSTTTPSKRRAVRGAAAASRSLSLCSIILKVFPTSPR